MATMHNPPHPGETLREEANPADLSQPDILMFRVRRIWPQPEVAWRTLTPRSWAEALLQIRRRACAKLDGVAANDPRW